MKLAALVVILALEALVEVSEAAVEALEAVVEAWVCWVAAEVPQVPASNSVARLVLLRCGNYWFECLVSRPYVLEDGKTSVVVAVEAVDPSVGDAASFVVDPEDTYSDRSRNANTLQNVNQNCLQKVRQMKGSVKEM